MTGESSCVRLRPLGALLVAIGCALQGSLCRQSAAAGPEMLPRIPAGTSFDEEPPAGWSNIILFVEGRLGSGDVAAASVTVQKYAKMFNLVILANVARVESGDHYLDKIGIGFSTKINGRNTVITSASQEKLEANLGLVARSVFAANETSLDEIKQVARYSGCVLFDAPTIMLHRGEHRTMVVRYLVLVSRSSGQLNTFVWLLDRDPQNEKYCVVANTLQRLPPNMREDRVMNVKEDRFTLGIPSKDAFALVRIPQGTRYLFTERLRELAGATTFTKETFSQLLVAVHEAVVAGQQSPVTRQRSAVRGQR